MLYTNAVYNARLNKIISTGMSGKHEILCLKIQTNSFDYTLKKCDSPTPIKNKVTSCIFYSKRPRFINFSIFIMKFITTKLLQYIAMIHDGCIV
jgi:hypothetical protein